MSENPFESPRVIQDVLADPVEPQSVVLAERGTRLVAVLVDRLLQAGCLLIIVIATRSYDRILNNQLEFLDLLAFTIGGSLIWLCLHGYLLITRGQTIGKSLTNIQIVDNKTNTLLPFVNVFLLRYFWVALLAVVCVLIPGDSDDNLIRVLVVVDVLLIFGSNQRCLHDYFAGSKVVEYVSTRTRTHSGIDDRPREESEFPFELAQIQKRVLFLEKMASSNGPNEFDLRTLRMIDSTVEDYLGKTIDVLTRFAHANREYALRDTVIEFQTRVNKASEKLT